MDNSNSINHKLRSSNSSTTSTIKQSNSSSSLLGRSRKVSSESLKSRPLKRANSLTYKVFTPTQIVLPSESSSSLKHSQSLRCKPKKIQTSFSSTISTNESILLNSPSSLSSPSPSFQSTYVNKFRRRFRSLRKSSSSTSISRQTHDNLTFQSSSPTDSFKSESFTANNNNYNNENNNNQMKVDNFIVDVSPPLSPINHSINDNETESDEFDTSCFSQTSNHDTRDSSFQFTSQLFTDPSSSESSPLSINKNNTKFKFNYSNYCKRNILQDLNNCNNEIIDINLTEDEFANYANDLNLLDNYESLEVRNSNLNNKRCHEIFEIPEILEIILRHVAHDYTDKIPTEPKLNRRPPLSYNHSLMIYGEEQGKKVWKRTTSNSSIKTLLNSRVSSNSGSPDTVINGKNPNLYNCLFVNKKWYFTMLSILNENLFFKTDSQFENFTSTLCTSNHIRPEPFSLVLHKIKSPQSIMDIFSTEISPRRLNWLEFYICPAILPPFHFISHSLKKLVLPGCKSLNDDHLKKLISKAPNLEHLDIRACDQITDASLYFIGNNCLKLQLLNCGRHTRGELISDVSIGIIAKNCPIRTIGLAGCGISDWAVWELALHCGSSLERLSLNYCWKLSDVGICRVIKAGLLESLSVLEIRGLRLNDVSDLVSWKKRRVESKNKVLIEACENLDKMMKDIEMELELQISNRIFDDINYWLETTDDDIENGDMDYRQFLANRRRRNGLVMR